MAFFRVWTADGSSIRTDTPGAVLNGDPVELLPPIQAIRAIEVFRPDAHHNIKPHIVGRGAAARVVTDHKV